MPSDKQRMDWLETQPMDNIVRLQNSKDVAIELPGMYPILAPTLRAAIDEAMEATCGVPGRDQNPCKLTECQGKPRCDKCVAMGLNVPDGVAPSRKPLRISDPEAAADVAALRNELKDPEKAAAFLREVGIITADGKLAPEFGGETPAGVKGLDE